MLVCFILVFCIGFFISLKYGIIMIKKTKVVGPHLIIACMIYFTISIADIIFWVVMTWGVNEFLFIGGIVLDLILFIIGEIALILVMLIKKKKILNT